MSKTSKLSTVIRFRVTPQDKELIDAAAQGVGLIPASYLRQLVLAGVRADLANAVENGPSIKTAEPRHPKEL